MLKVYTPPEAYREKHDWKRSQHSITWYAQLAFQLQSWPFSGNAAWEFSVTSVFILHLPSKVTGATSIKSKEHLDLWKLKWLYYHSRLQNSFTHLDHRFPQARPIYICSRLAHLYFSAFWHISWFLCQPFKICRHISFWVSVHFNHAPVLNVRKIVCSSWELQRKAVLVNLLKCQHSKFHYIWGSVFVNMKAHTLNKTDSAIEICPS